MSSRCPFLIASQSRLAVLPRACPFIHPSSVPRTFRAYSSRANAEPPKKNVLLGRAAVGFAAGLSMMLFFKSREVDKNVVHCDDSPISPFVGDAPMAHRSLNDGETFVRGKNDVYKQSEEHPAIIHEKDDSDNPMRIRMSQFVMRLQDDIVNALESLEVSQPPNEHSSSLDPPAFFRDHWLRPNGGGEGSSCTLSGGRIFEKAGVNVSVINGVLPPAAIRQMKGDHKSLKVDAQTSLPYFVAGISLVLHPWNPHAPTVHMNMRYFEVEPPGAAEARARGEEVKPLAWWFGGGSDLTPSYLYPEDAVHFHRTLKETADAYDERYYPAWKAWCDKYFYISHRGEARGIGGIFFDDLTTESEIHQPSFKEKVRGIVAKSVEPPSQDQIFKLVASLGNSFLPSYLPILERRHNTPFTDEERRWQLMRRGRYVEFNLVHDRGTKFGLMTPGARIESILMSLPETARWEYMSDMGAEGTREGELIEVLKNPKEWV